jgi:ribosome-binding protein aMBF1 (putative translation factor)
MTQTLTIEGKRYYLLDESEYKRLSGAPSEMPELPAPDARGNVPAVQYVRSLIARRIIASRTAMGLSQAELARRAGIRVETLNRIENCKHSADPKSIDRIEKALEKAKLHA